MKKRSILALFILILAACNSPQDTSPAENEEVEQEEVTEDQTNEEAADEEEEVEAEQSDESNGQEETTNGTEGNSISSVNKSSSENKQETKNETEVDEHQELVDLTYKIFAAQNNKDYDFLQSILSKGSKLDKQNNQFIFENVTYPHEQAFLTEKNAGDLQFRYTHENNADSVIVGFAAIDYENEYSYVIDFEFIREDGKWKMNDMDINK